MSTFTTTFIFPIGETLGGANIWSARLCGHLDRSGRSTAAIVHANPGWHPDEPLPIPAGTRRVACPGPPVTEARLRDVRRYVEQYEGLLPAVIVPNFHETTYAACAELSRRRAADLRVIGVAHGNNEAYFGTLTRYEPIIHAFIAVSDEIAGELKRRLPHRAVDIHMRACPVDVPESCARGDRGPSDPLVITYIGRLTNHEKKVSNLAPLMAELGRRGVDFRFRVIGEGGYRATLEYEISCLSPDVQRRVSLEGGLPPDRIPSVWRATDVCVLVSDSEGTSISMLESMSAGCVPVVTRVSGVAGVIEEGTNGFVVERGDMAAMAGVIARLAADRALVRRIGEAAYQTVKARYSYDTYTPWFAGLMDDVVAMPSRVWPADAPLLPPGFGKGRSGWSRGKERAQAWVRRVYNRLRDRG